MVGDTPVMVSNGSPDDGHGQGLLLIVHVDDVDAHHRATLAAGVAAPTRRSTSLPPRLRRDRPLGIPVELLARRPYVEGGVNTLHEITV